MTWINRWRFASPYFNALVTCTAVFVGLPWLALFSLSHQAARALIPKGKGFLYWPSGLLAVIVSNYLFYWLMWAFNKNILSPGSSMWSWIIQSMGFLIISQLRTDENSDRHSEGRQNKTQIFLWTLMILLPYALILWTTQRLYSNPNQLISGYLGGGDHAAHSQIVHRMLGWGPSLFGASPVRIDTYPNGLHFLIANLVALDKQAIGTSTIGRVYSWSSWFEWIQFISYIQLFITIVAGSLKKINLLKIVYAHCALAFMFLMNNYIFHLFWSGFTTSLGSTWILLTIPTLALIEYQNFREFVYSVWVWIPIGIYGIWIVYQPLLICIAILTIAIFGMALAERPNSNVLFKTIEKHIVTLSFFAASGIILIPYLLQGKNNSFVSTLLVDGATTHPNIYTMAMVVILSIALNTAVPKILKYSVIERIPFQTNAIMISALLGVISSLIVIVIRTSNLTVLSQPYYVQKLFWLLIFVGAPTLFAGSVPLIEVFKKISGTPNTQAIFLMFLLPLVALIQGRTIQSAERHLNVHWFANSMSQISKETATRSIAFSKSDPLGSHVANLALASVSQVTMPVDFSLEANPEKICEFVRSNGIRSIFTDSSTRKILLDADCPRSIQYFEDGLESHKK